MSIETPAGQAVPSQLGFYQVQEKIGQGGMAMVFKGIQPSLNRPVAIKILPPQFAANPELLGRFEREATIVAQLAHSNIVQVIDRGRQDELLYIVMEFVEGESLDQMIRKGPLPVARALDYAAQICDGLSHAHGIGVVHRDLKPSNILIEQRTDRIKIADFGIASIDTSGGGFSTLTYGQSSIGTMNYMSPEQRLDAHRVTHLTDLFALGVILYEMLTGKLPLGHFKLPSAIRPDLPLGLDAIVKKCLAEAPGDRYQSAEELRQALASVSTRHRAPPALSHLGRLNKRQRWYLVGGIAAVGLLAVTGLALALRPRRRQSGPELPVASAPAPAETGVQADYAQAQGLMSGGKWQEAARLLDALLRRAPEHALAPEIAYALATATELAGETARALSVFDQLAQRYPDSPRTPQALVARTRLRWQQAPHRRRMLGSETWDAATQSLLIEELREVLRRFPAGDHQAAALELIATIAEPPALADYRAAADAWLALARLSPTTAPDPLHRAAVLLDRRLNDASAAAEAYQRFADTYPTDARAESARQRTKVLVPTPPPAPNAPD